MDPTASSSVDHVNQSHGEAMAVDNGDQDNIEATNSSSPQHQELMVHDATISTQEGTLPESIPTEQNSEVNITNMPDEITSSNSQVAQNNETMTGDHYTIGAYADTTSSSTVPAISDVENTIDTQPAISESSTVSQSLGEYNNTNEISEDIYVPVTESEHSHDTSSLVTNSELEMNKTDQTDGQIDTGILEQSASHIITTTADFVQEHVSSTENLQYTTAADSTTNYSIDSESGIDGTLNISQLTSTEANNSVQLDDSNISQLVTEGSADLKEEIKEEIGEIENNSEIIVEPAVESENQETIIHEIQDETQNIPQVSEEIVQEIVPIESSAVSTEELPSTSKSLPTQPSEVIPSNNQIEVDNIAEESQVEKEQVLHNSKEVQNVTLEYPNDGETVYIHDGEIHGMEGVEQIYIVEDGDNVLVMAGEESSQDLPESETSADTIEVQLEKINNEEEEEEEEGYEDDIVNSQIQEVPSHVLGRNIENPLNDPFRNGKVPPKPRLGVKVPYRNLTSQIVSKQEIVNEVMKRAKQRNAAKEMSPTGNTLFAKKLTQRLAKKIVPPEMPSKEIIISNNPQSSQAPTPPAVKGKIENNSDLLAILEGDGDDIALTDNSEVEFASLKDLEKQIALKQLKEMQEPKRLPRRLKGDKGTLLQNPIPNDVKEQKVLIKTEQTNTDLNTEPQNKEGSDDKNPEGSADGAAKTSPAKAVEKSSKNNPSNKKSEVTAISKDDSNKSSPSKINKEEKENVSVSSKSLTSQPEAGDSANVEVKDDLDVVPKFSTKMAVKTYTRKRKQEQDEETEEAVITKKIATLPTTPTTSNKVANSPIEVYVTKSSRIIKKKVIWDPDETPKLGTFKSPNKVESKPQTPPTPKIIKKGIKAPVLPSKTPSTSSSTTTPQKPTSTSSESVTTKHIKVIKKVTPEIKQKRLSEIDKLLMDEGAIKMLYEMKKPDENQNTSKLKKSKTVDLEKAEKELMTKSKELKTELKMSSSDSKVSPKTLRRKELSPVKSPEKVVTPATISRQKSKDSSRSSVHSPPPSPAMVYAEASRIIRRHSSSSYSSEDEDTTDEAKDEKPSKPENNTQKPENERSLRKKASTTPLETPKSKRLKKTETVITINDKKKGEESSKKFEKLTKEQPVFKTLTVKTMDSLSQIVLAPNKQNKVHLTNKVLKEVTTVVNNLNGDADCHVILISSSGNSFCHGINYKNLVADKDATRKSVAKELVNNMRDFLSAIANSRKILVAAVHGDVEGIGVMMLPLFDMVIASDTATFSTPYGKLGCAPEAACLFTLPNLMSNVLISELLLAPRKMIATEAQRLGLVSRILWPDKFQDEIVSSSKLIANQGSQFLEATKQLTRKNINSILEEGLKNEGDLLIKHWTSAECQKKFSQYE